MSHESDWEWLKGWALFYTKALTILLVAGSIGGWVFAEWFGNFWLAAILSAMVFGSMAIVWLLDRSGS